MYQPKYSLVMCTLGRDTVVREFLDSLIVQTYKNFECIIVDQNPDNRLESIVSGYSNKFEIKHIRSNVKGLSINRNLGVAASTGQIIAFPDDDCQYLETTLADVLELFKQSEADIININIRGIGTDHYFIGNKGALQINRYNYRPYGISICIFIAYKSKDDVRLDERLGAGQYFGADEESDLLSSLLEKGYKAEYHGDKYVRHPAGTSHVPADKLEQRYRSYGLGYGALLKKEIFLRHKYRMIWMFGKDTIGRFIGGCLPVKKRKLYMISAIARIRGFIEYKIEE